MKRLSATFVTIVAVVAVVTTSIAPAAHGGQEQERVDMATQWNVHATNALFGAGQPPQQSVPHLAMVHGAIYDAVNAIDGGHDGYLLTGRIATPHDSKDAAAATAAYRMLVHLLPASESTLTDQYEASLADLADGSSTRRGIAVGEAAAAAMIAARTDDGRFGPFRFAVGSGPGVWEPVLPSFVNDPNAWLKDVRPFLLDSPSQVRTTGPLPLRGRRYARELHEVQVLGSATSTRRTEDQTTAAQYWNENPPATWSRIVRTVVGDHELSVVDAARLYAEVYLTAADSLIVVWNEKARWSFWRPITAIRRADTDGNPATVADPDWLPLLRTPPYPEHPSGHLGLSGGVAATLRDSFGTDRLAWTDTNSAGLTRSFTRLSDAVEEIVGARVWSGMHFRTADEAAVRIGEQVAWWRERHFFERRHDRSRRGHDHGR